jgi:hypothetical protein
VTNEEQIYALFVSANPVADVDSLLLPPEDGSIPQPTDLRVVGESVGILDIGATLPKMRGRYLSVAAVLLAVVGFGAFLIRDVASPEPAVSTQRTVAVDAIVRVEEFFVALDSGDVDGAVGLLDDPLGSIYFPALDEVTSTDHVVDYLEFYDVLGGHTDLSDCISERMGPRSIVTCQADQQIDALIPIGLEFPPFPLIFEVWDAGIRRISFDPASKPVFDHVFGSSRFFDFFDRHIRPNGLAQDSGGPVWSKENGERVVELVQLYIAEWG